MNNESMEAKIASLNNIQSIINRLAETSSKLKATYITIISAVLTIVIAYVIPQKPVASENFTTNEKLYSILIFLIITLAFMLIDSYYLRYERAMRKVYDLKAEDTKDSAGKINYFEISNAFNYVLKNQNIKSRPSRSQFIFYVIPFLAIAFSIAVLATR